MKIDKISRKECLAHMAATSAKGQPRIVLFADFLPDENEMCRASLDFAGAAQASGARFTSITLATESFSQVALTCRTPMYFQRAQRRIETLNLPRATAVIVVLESFSRAELQSATGYRRIKERRRILFLLASILHARPDATLIESGPADRRYLRLAKLICMLRYGTRAQPDIRPEADMLTGAMTRGLIKYSGQTRSGPIHTPQATGLTRSLRLSEQGLSAVLETEAHADEFRFLLAVASDPALRTHPTRRWLMASPSPQIPFYDTPEPTRQMDMAQDAAPEAATFGPPITRYMMHLHRVLQLGREFPLRNRAQAQAFVTWYRKRSFERVPAGWVPCPPEAGDGNDTSRKTRARSIVLAVFNGALPQTGGDREMLVWLAGNPAGIGPSRFAILLAILCQIQCRLPAGQPLWKSGDIRRWFEDTACRLIPACRRFALTILVPDPLPDRLEIYGMPGNGTGLGANARMAATMARELGLPYVLHDTEPERPDIVPGIRTAGRQMRRSVILHQMNADRIPLYVMSPALARRADACHIGFLLWELDRMPEAHRLGVEMLDEIWAPSRFVADLYAREAETPVHLVRKGLAELDALERLSQQQRPQGGTFTALVCFDFHSSVERKNPLAAVRAFRIAFPRRRFPDCRLIVKTTPTSRGHWGDPANQMGQIRRLAAKDPRISIIEAFVSQQELWRMMRDADCILSTHRAEGFGYIPAQALALARPLVTTDYGGQRDFCTPETSFPVAAPLVEVRRGHAMYHQPGSRWADVPPEAVAAALRQVYDGPGYAGTRALRGQELMRRGYSMSAFAACCEHRLQQIGAL